MAFAQEAWPARPGTLCQRFSGRRRHRYAVAHSLPEDERAVRTVLRCREPGGAGGVLGADAVAKSAPDGYTVGLGGIASNVLAIGSYAKLPYDPRGDFTFIGGMWQLPNILCARKDLFSSDLKELLAAFKKEPRKYTYASAGFGTTLHLSGEMMNSMAGVEVDPHSLQGRRPGADRSARRPRRPAVRQSAGLAAERARRADQAGRRHLARAHSRTARCAGHGRGAAGI